MIHSTANPNRRGSVIIVVVWAIAITALVVSAVQLFAYRQAITGREEVGRIKARWAARAGIEYIMSIMADHSLNPDPDNAYAMILDMEAFSEFDFEHAQTSYEIHHQIGARKVRGPRDEHSKFNINHTLSGAGALISLFDDMSPDLAAGIMDWLDEDDNAGALGAERDWYIGHDPPYEPRNGPMHSPVELELVGGVWPEIFRGEDWNLNGKLDPNEDDGDASWPPDDADGRLDGGWAAWLTTYSNTRAVTDSGLPRVRLWSTDVEELVTRLQVTEAQAGFLINHGRTNNATLGQLIINNADTQNGPQFTDEHMRAIFAECTLDRPGQFRPGRINLNTVPEDLLRRLLEAQEDMVDEILYMRDNIKGGITSIMDLADIENMQPQVLSDLSTRFGTRSNVFTISCRGRSWGTGMEVEIIAVVDRSKVPEGYPVRILEYREQ